MTIRTTPEQHRVVHDYLAELDRELSKLPRTRARELRAELVDHLQEVVPSDANALETKQILQHVGEPHDLIAEALGDERPLPRWRRVRARTWIALGTVIGLLTAGTVTAVTLISRYAGADKLRCGCAIVLFDDGVPATPVVSHAGGVTQLLIPAHFGHRLGFAFAVVNDTEVTQTILGPGYPEEFNGWEGDPRTARFEVSTENADDPASDRLQFTTAPMNVAPHSARVIRVSNVEPCYAAGATISMLEVPIRVRVGVFTRTDEVALSSAVAIKRVRTPGCPANGR